MLQASYLILLGSGAAASRHLQGDNDTAIATDGGIDVFMNSSAVDDPISPIDLVATTATPTEPATTKVVPTTQSVDNTAATEAAETSASAGTQTANGSGTALIFDNGEQNTLDPNQLSDNTNIQVINSSTLFITDNGITLNGFCDGCIFPNSTIDVAGSSTLVIRGDDISIYGSNQAGIANDAGGSAIELSGKSRGMIDGSILIQGGEGDETAGVGGDALALVNEASVEISGAVLQGGVGVDNGKALIIDTASTAKVNSGTFMGSVMVEDGSIDLYGGTFDEGVTLNGLQASATVYGCFTASSVQENPIERTVELSGTFVNSSEVQTISVSLVEGATLKIDGGGECSDLNITTDTGNNATVGVDDDFTDDIGNSTSFPPTYMPTTAGPENDGARATVNSMLALGFVIGHYVFNFF